MSSLAVEVGGVGGLINSAIASIPKPPPLPNISIPPSVVSGVGIVAKGVTKVLGAGAAAVATELLFPRPTAKSDLTSIDQALLESGTEEVITVEVPGEVPFYGGQQQTKTYNITGYLEFNDTLRPPNQNPYATATPGASITGQILGLRYVPGSTNRLWLDYIDQYGVQRAYQFYYSNSSSNRYYYTGYKITNITRQDGTPIAQDIAEGGNPPAVGGEPPILSISGIQGLEAAGFVPPDRPLTSPEPLTKPPIGPAYTGLPNTIAPTIVYVPIPGVVGFVPPPAPEPPGEVGTYIPPEPEVVEEPVNLVPVSVSPPEPEVIVTEGTTFINPTPVKPKPTVVPPTISTITSTTSPTSTTSTTDNSTSLTEPANPVSEPLTAPGETVEAPLGGKDLTVRGDPLTLPPIAPPVTRSPGTISTTPPKGPPAPVQTGFAGGCSCGPAINAQGDRILDALGLGGQAVDLSLLQVINRKLGDEVDGGLSGWLKRFSNSLKLDRVMNILSTMLLLHNAAQLSRSLVDSLSYFIDSGLNAIGLKDEDDNPLNISEYIGTNVQEYLKGLVGEEIYNSLSEGWKKTSAIYTSAINIYESILSATAGIAEALQITGNYTGRIGNALKRSGVVLENSYNWMDDNLRIKTGKHAQIERVIDGLQLAEDVTSNLTEVTETINETTETVNTIKGEVETIRTTVSDNEEAKKVLETTAKTASASPDIDSTDLIQPTN